VSRYELKKAELVDSWRPGAGQVRLAKSTISNLFRYQTRGAPARRLALGAFNERHLGFPRFKDFLMSAQKAGIIRIETRGYVTWVAPPNGRSGASSCTASARSRA